jgi:branched-chain amino acid transport system permease protein
MSSDWISFDFTALFDSFWATTFDGLTLGAIYALVALGYTLVYGVLNLINFAHSEVFIAGAFAVVFFLSALGFGPSAPNLPLGMLILDLVLAGIIAMVVSGGTAILVERIAYKPLRDRGASRLAFLISAIGMSFVLQYIFFEWRGPNAEASVTMFRPEPIFDVFGGIIDSLQLTIVIAAVVMMICVDQIVRPDQALGRGIRAVAEDPDTATLMGVNRGAHHHGDLRRSAVLPGRRGRPVLR